MLHAVAVGLLVVAFVGAGLVNAIGAPTTRSSFVRWGYPGWWCRVTGALDMAAAVLIALPSTLIAGLILGAIIIAAAAVTVVRHRDFSHLVPLGVFAALLGFVSFSS